jgi:hypothetical protein
MEEQWNHPLKNAGGLLFSQSTIPHNRHLTFEMIRRKPDPVDTVEVLLREKFLRRVKSLSA